MMSNLVLKMKRKVHLFFLRKQNKNKDFTMISQNCLAGCLYSDLELEFSSPTINMFIEDENFVKLVENLEYYLSIPAKPFIDSYIDPKDSTIVYPKIKVGDIEICCLHYKSCDEAVEAWERRKKRVNMKKIYIVANSWNMHQRRDLVERICKSKYPTVCFTYGKLGGHSECIELVGKVWRLDDRGIVRPNLTDIMEGNYKRNYEKYFDFVKWLNQ